MRTFNEPQHFLWDKGNINKNWEKHRVSNQECEEVFFDKGKVIYHDVFHSDNEVRYILIGNTQNDRLIYVVFTKRGSKTRIISARDVDKKERRFYEKNT